MLGLRLYTPALLLFVSLVLRLLGLAAQPPVLALDPVQLTSDATGPTEPQSSHSFGVRPESHYVLTPPADPGFRYLRASAASEMSSPLQSGAELPEEGESSPWQWELRARHPERSEEVGASPLQEDTVIEPPSLPDETLTQPPGHPKAVRESPLQKEALTQPPGLPEEDKASPIEDETLTQPPGLPKEDKTAPIPEVVLPQLQELPEELNTSLQDEAISQRPELPEENEASFLEDETLTQSPGLPKEDKTPLFQEVALTQIPVLPKVVKTTPSHQEVPPQTPQRSNLYILGGIPTDLEPTIAPIKDPEVTLPNPAQGHNPYPHLSEVTLQPLDLGLTITPEPNTDVAYAKVFQPTIAPRKDRVVTVAHLSQGHTAHRHLTEATVPPETVAQATEKTMNQKRPICELCACKDKTLSCTGLSPQRRLRRLPVPDASATKGTFTILNFQGNSIAHIDKNVWKSYHLAEKLNLSNNEISEIRKDSFEGLLSLQYLDLSCNKIENIERGAFASLPFLQYINLGCNTLTEIKFGTFEAWHRMQFLNTLILHQNPLTAIEDTYLFKLPSLKYLDLGTTQVPPAVIESILMMSLKLEKLILPSHMASCLSQLRTEVVCKTVKVHCDPEYLTNLTPCGKTFVEGSFMKVLRARKKHTSTELTIEPETASSHKNGFTLSSFMSDQPGSNDESALNCILPYFSKGNLQDVKSILLPFIKLLLSKTQDGDMTLSSFIQNTGSPFVKPEPKVSTYVNELENYYTLHNFLDAAMQETIAEIKKEEEPAMQIHFKTLGSIFKHKRFPKKLEPSQPQEDILTIIERVAEELLRKNAVPEDPTDIPVTEEADENIRRQENTPPTVENTIKGERPLRPFPQKRTQLLMMHWPRGLVRNSFNMDPSRRKDHKAAATSLLRTYWMGRPPASTFPRSLPELQEKSEDFSNSVSMSKDVNAKLPNKPDPETISPSGEDLPFRESGSPVIHRTPKDTVNEKLRQGGSLYSLMLVKGPLSSAGRSLIESPAQKPSSSGRALTSEENPLPGLTAPSESSTEYPTAESQIAGKTSVPGVVSEITVREDIPTACSATAADNSVTMAKQMKEGQGEPHSLGMVSSCPGDLFEEELNQRLGPLIPSNNVRKLFSHVIWTLKVDCSEVSVQVTCANLLFRTGLLMKLLSEQQKERALKEKSAMDQWKNENYVSENTEAQVKQKGQESREQFLGYGYHNKLILAISVAIVVMTVVIISCLIQICCNRPRAGEGKERSTRGFSHALLPKRHSPEHESEDGFLRKKHSLWLKDLFKPLSAGRQKYMAEQLHYESSDEDATFNEDNGKLREVMVMKPSEKLS